MANVQVRLPEDLEAGLDALADQVHGSRSDALRMALAEGIRALREKRAVEAYIDGRMSLEGAANEAGIPLHAFAARIAATGTPYIRYTPEDAQRDSEALD